VRRRTAMRRVVGCVFASALVAPLLAGAAPAVPQSSYSVSALVAVADAVAAPRTVSSLGTTTSYKLYKLSDGRVLRWNPCSTIHYRTNLKQAPAGALTDVKAAIAKVAAATGLKFVYDGSTTVIPQTDYAKSMSPTKVPPLVIAWAKRGTGAGASNLLGGEAYAIGGWRALGWSDGDGNHPMRAMSGMVVVDVRSNTLPAGFATRRGGTRGGMLLHELGHVVGLQHVSDTTQEMNPTIIDRASFGNGDKTGLKKVGAAAGCIA
jgi:hypothetical protein